MPFTQFPEQQGYVVSSQTSVSIKHPEVAAHLFPIHDPDKQSEPS